MVAYYGQLKMMWDELVNHEPIPTCSCGGCACKIIAVLEKQREDERLHQFLIGLDDGIYATVRSNILSMVSRRHRTIARSKDNRSDVVGFSTQAILGAQASAARVRDKTGNCGHCGKTGHEASECFQVIGYPKWWGDRPRGGG